MDKISLDSVVDTRFNSIKQEEENSAQIKTDKDLVQLENIIDVDKQFNSLGISEAIGLDKATGPDYNFNTLEIRTEAFIRIFRTGISGLLASTLWIALIASGIWHTYMIGVIANKTLENGQQKLEITENKNEEVDFEANDKASAMVGDTAKTLYAVISPLATAITGFYFVIKKDKSESNKS